MRCLRRRGVQRQLPHDLGCHDLAQTRAAITQEILFIDAQDRVHLQLQIVTLTASPFEPSATSLDHPAGWELESLGTSQCVLETSPRQQYRCRHDALLLATSTCSGSGDYRMALTYSCSPDSSLCTLCSEPETVAFQLNTSNFCGSPTIDLPAEP